VNHPNREKKMNNTRNALYALVAVAGFFAWRNRFAIQRQLESWGVKTPLLRGSLDETARSIASKAGGRMERGATLAENLVNRRTANY